MLIFEGASAGQHIAAGAAWVDLPLGKPKGRSERERASQYPQRSRPSKQRHKNRQLVSALRVAEIIGRGLCWLRGLLARPLLRIRYGSPQRPLCDSISASLSESCTPRFGKIELPPGNLIPSPKAGERVIFSPLGGELCGPMQDSHSAFRSVSFPETNHFSVKEAAIPSGGVTLLELLVTITVIAAVASLSIPAWSAIIRAGAGKNADRIVMESMEQARTSAIAARKEVWVVFDHAPAGKPDGLRIISRNRDTVSADGGWHYLPKGIAFHPGAGTLLEEQPPSEVLSSAINGNRAPGETFGGVLFQRSGRIGLPAQGGNQLTLRFDSDTGSTPEPINISRATGRASCK